jgi:phosphotransferase system IIB component
VLNNNHSLTCMRQVVSDMPQVNDLVLNNNHSLTCMRQVVLDTTVSYK